MLIHYYLDVRNIWKYKYIYSIHTYIHNPSHKSNSLIAH